MIKYFLLLVVSIILVGATMGKNLLKPKDTPINSTETKATREKNIFPTSTKTAEKNTILKPLASSKTLQGGTHMFQTFNNCGPASMSMTLSYFGIIVGQREIGLELRPYQNMQGVNDDKSVTLQEMAEYAKKYKFEPFHRPNGNAEVVKHFINNDIPVIARTWLKPDDDVGHYRVVKGYTTTHFIQDDSYQGKNLEYTFDEFDVIWQKFNYEYLVLIPQDKLDIAKEILGENYDYKSSWEIAVKNARQQLEQDPNNVDARFNLSVALYNTGDPKAAVTEYEKVENKLAFRTLWYQIEPIKAYFDVGNYPKALAIIDKVLNNGNRAYSELYTIRGDIYTKQGMLDKAKDEYQKAQFYKSPLSI